MLTIKQELIPHKETIFGVKNVRDIRFFHFLNSVCKSSNLLPLIFQLQSVILPLVMEARGRFYFF